MIDLGHPFVVEYRQVIETLEDRLRYGTEQPAQWRFVFQNAVRSYELPRDATAITSVSGFVGRTYTSFSEGVHYRLAGNRLVWVNEAVRPADVSRVDVDYTDREQPSGLTDFNEGSVVGTIVRAVAREMALLYGQIDQAYRRAFIDFATGSALDNVVALLGIVRNEPIRARGPVTYLRRKATDKPIAIVAGQRVAAPGGRTFRTLADAVIAVLNDEFVEHEAGVVHTTDQLAELLGVWPRTADPDVDDPLPTKPTLPDQPLGADARVVTLASAPAAGELRVQYRPKSATVEAEAVEPGPEGNVERGAITVMPTPPAGVNGVINEQPMQGGREAEPDDQLSERAKHALERAGNATLNALRFGVLDVDGIDEVDVVDHAADPSLSLGEVRLRYSASQAVEDVDVKVAAAVAATRAAGIRVVAARVEERQIAGTFYLIPDAVGADDADQRFLAAVVDEIKALTIGSPLPLRRLNANAFQVGGLADVAEAQLTVDGERIETDPLVVTNAQLIRVDPEDLHAVLLRALHVSSSAGPAGATNLDIQIVDGDGTPLTLVGAMPLSLTIELAATRKTAPDQPAVRVGSVTREATLTASTVTVQVKPSVDAPGYDPGEHRPALQATVTAPAFPGLRAATAVVVAS